MVVDVGVVLIAENSVESPRPCRYELGSVEVVVEIGGKQGG